MSEVRSGLWAVLTVMSTVLMAGCATTSITSQATPAARTAQYDTLLVFAAFDDLDMQKLAEGELKVRLGARGVSCQVASEVFLPGVPLEADEVLLRLEATRAQALLVVTSYATGETEHYQPPTYYTQGNAWTGRSKTTVVGGYSYRKPWAKFRAEIVDLRTAQTTWVATANSKGNAYATGHTLLRSFCGEILNRLTSDQVVPGFSTGAR